MLLEVLEGQIDLDVRRALEEDIGEGDITARLVPENDHWRASVICREQAILCGQHWFNAVFSQLDEHVTIDWACQDGETIHPGATVCILEGPARALLSGERTALNFLQTLSGTATLASRYARQVEGLGTRVLDTRKTIPGLRHAQKYAVRCGGCHNHRMGLYDAFLIKENHIAAAGSIAEAILAARALANELPVEVEVEGMDELMQALDAGAERILLDNFSVEDTERAVARNARRAELELSGNVSLDNLRRYAETGVDFISVGALTKHVHAIDLSMRLENLPTT